MSSATATFTQAPYPQGQEFGQKTETLRGTISIPATAGSPPVATTYIAGGLPLSFVGSDPFTLAEAFQAQVWSTKGSGYVYVFNPANSAGSPAVKGTLQIFEFSGSPALQTELGNGTNIPAAVGSDTIWIEAKFNKFDFFTT